MIKKFNQYNESLRDKMTPKSDEELAKIFGDMTPDQKVKNGYDNNMVWLSEEGITEGGNPKPFGNYFSKALSNGWIDIVRFMVNNEYADVHDYEKSNLRRSADSGNADLVDLLVNEYGCRVGFSMTECLEWIKKGYIDVVKIFISKDQTLKDKLEKKSNNLIQLANEIKKCI